MKLAHPDMEQKIIWSEQKECEWIIESPVIFTAYLQELCIQNEGGEGKFVLSNGDICLDMVKDVEIVIDPMNLNINDKKVLTKVYSELKNIAYDETTYLKTQQLISNLRQYFWELEYKSSVALDIDEEVDIQMIFKTLGVKIEEKEYAFWENIIIYIKTVSEVLRKKVLVLVNIRSFITDAQLEELLDCAVYNEIRILFIESAQRTCNHRIKRYIIDDIGCEI